MSFFNSKNKFTYTLSISLKSSSIDFQLINSTHPFKKEVLFVEREIMLLENSQDPLLYTSQYTKKLSELFEKNHTKIKQLIQNNPLSIHFILYSPWFTSSINIISQLEPVILDEKFVSQKIEQFQTNKKLKILENQIIKIQTNGYRLEQLTETKTSDIHLQIYSSYISEQIQDLLTKVVQKYFPLKDTIHYTTSPLLISDSIKRFMVKEDNVTFLNIGGEITEMGIIKDDTLDYFTTFPIGIHDFLRGIQSNIKTYDYDILYQKEIQIKIEKNKEQFELLKKTWQGQVDNSLKIFGGNVPNKIIIITDQKAQAFFIDLLSESIKSNEESTLKNHRIINFDISLLKDIILYKTPIGEGELDLKLEALT